MMPSNEFVQWVKQRFSGAHPGNVGAFLEAVCKVDSVEFYQAPWDNCEYIVICIGEAEYQHEVPRDCIDGVAVGCTRLIGEALRQ